MFFPRITWKDGIYTAMNEEVSEWENGTTAGNGIWKSEGVARRFKAARHI
jgi:hypothetical protein